MHATEENCVVMHTQTRAGMAVAALNQGLQQVSMSFTSFYGDIAYHDDGRPSLDLDEHDCLAAFKM